MFSCNLCVNNFIQVVESIVEAQALLPASNDLARRGSLGGDAQLNSLFALLLCHLSEEGDLLFIWWLPLVIAIECVLQVGLDVYIEGLWF